MTYATVMVSLALDQSNEARLEAAGQIAERFDAGIVGIAASQFSPPLYFTSGELAQDLIDEGQASIKKRIGELEGQFREAVKNRAAQVEWRSAIDFPARYILREARCADIIVSGARPGRAFGSAGGGQPEGSRDAGGPAAAHRSRFCRLARFAKRAGGLEGYHGGEAGDRRCTAHDAQGQERHRRGDPGGGRQPGGGRLAGPRRRCVAVASWRFGHRTRRGEGWGPGRDRAAGWNCRRRSAPGSLSRAPMVIRDSAN